MHPINAKVKSGTSLYLLFFVAMWILHSCSPKVTTSLQKHYEPSAFDQEVAVIGLEQTAPDDAEKLGTVKIGDSGFTTNCTYADVIEKAKLEVLKAGGNALKIIQHRQPTAMGSSCHQITATILKVKDLSSIAVEEENEPVIPNVDYAILNIYRYSGPGALIGYDLYLGNDLLCRVVNNYKTSTKVTKTGMNSIWAKTESKDEIPVDIEPGKQYYIRCSLNFGLFVGRPKLELVDWKTGKAEFESFTAKHQ